MEPFGTSSLVGGIFLVSIGLGPWVVAMRAKNFPSSHPWMGAFASEAASLTVGIFGRFLGRSLKLDKSAFGLAWIGGDDKGRCRNGGDAWWNLDVKALAALDATCDVLKLMDFVFGQLGCRKDDGESFVHWTVLDRSCTSA